MPSHTSSVGSKSSADAREEKHTRRIIWAFRDIVLEKRKYSVSQLARIGKAVQVVSAEKRGVVCYMQSGWSCDLESARRGQDMDESELVRA